MKYNKYYALSKVPGLIKNVDNGIKDDQLVKEGTDNFVQEDKYFKAYALYFKNSLKHTGKKILKFLW